MWKRPCVIEHTRRTPPGLPFFGLLCRSRNLGFLWWPWYIRFLWSRNLGLRSLWCWCAWFVSHNQPLYHAACKVGESKSCAKVRYNSSHKRAIRRTLGPGHFARFVSIDALSHCDRYSCGCLARDRCRCRTGRTFRGRLSLYGPSVQYG